jgi:hypothetical protein
MILSHKALRAVIAARRSGMVMGSIAMWLPPYKALIFLGLPTSFGTRGKTPGKEENRQMPCNYGTLLKSNFGFCKSYLIEQITSMLHYLPIQNFCQG